MIRFEDLMAARIVFQQLPDQRDWLMRSLQTLSDTAANRSLLSELVSSKLLTLDQAHYVHHQVEGHKRERHLALYLHLLGGAGVDNNTLVRLRQQVGQEANVDAVGEAICATESCRGRASSSSAFRLAWPSTATWRTRSRPTSRPTRARPRRRPRLAPPSERLLRS